jgi:L,D-transpeptidase YcbB
LTQPVPVYWVYVTAWATPDGIVQFRDDIYQRDGFGAGVASAPFSDGYMPPQQEQPAQSQEPLQVDE